MMSFDTLSYAKKLREAGVPEQQAEVHAQAVQTLLEERLATKQDIELVRRDTKELDSRLLQEIGGVRNEIELLWREIELLRREIKELESRMVQKIELVRKDVLIKLGAIVVACTGVLAALLGTVIALIQLR